MKKMQQKRKFKLSSGLIQWGIIGLIVSFLIKNIIDVGSIQIINMIFGTILLIGLMMYLIYRNSYLSDYGYVTVRIKSAKLAGGIQDFIFPVNAVPSTHDHIDIYGRDGNSETLKIIRKRYQMSEDKLKVIYYECLV